MMSSNNVDYTLGVYSYQENSTDIAKAILNYENVRRLVFPARIAVSSTDYIALSSVDDFHLSMLPKEYYNDLSVGFTLVGEDGIRFHMVIGFKKELALPHVITLGFGDAHLESGLVNLPVIKEILAQAISIVDADSAMVWDRRNPIPENTRYFRDQKRRHYPAEMGWLTYFGPRLLDFLGRDRFSKLRTYAEKYDLNGGLMIVLQEEPFHNDNPEHMKRRMRAEAELKLDRLK
jgi:hypothetical protein